MSGAWSIYGGEERCIKSFGGEIWGKEATRKTEAYMGDNIKMNLQGGGLWAWTGIIWLRVGTGGGNL